MNGHKLEHSSNSKGDLWSGSEEEENQGVHYQKMGVSTKWRCRIVRQISGKGGGDKGNGKGGGRGLRVTK